MVGPEVVNPMSDFCFSASVLPMSDIYPMF